MTVDLPILNEVDLDYDTETKALWQFMKPTARPSFTPGLLRDLTLVLDLADAQPFPIHFMILASKMPGIFNLGGDLPHFIKMIQEGNREKLLWYAQTCAKGQYRRAADIKAPVCTIAIVQGDALGGGFEAALSHDILISERNIDFGLPEILFNMFPGMGAYNFLSRRLNPRQAEKIILSGRIYKSEELYEMGVVDVLAEPGKGIEEAHHFIKQFKYAHKTRQSLLQARRLLQPLNLDEFTNIATLWVDAALTLGKTELRRMELLARAQDRRWGKISAN